LEPRPFEKILQTLDGIEGGSRAEFRRSIGAADDSPPALAETPALPPADDDLIVDAEDGRRRRTDRSHATPWPCHRRLSADAAPGLMRLEDGWSHDAIAQFDAVR
jgi:hypothetical protein